MTLPQGWTWTTLGEVSDTTQRRVNPQEHPTLPYIGVENVEAHMMRLLGTVPANEMRSTAESFAPGDILYGRLRQSILKQAFEGKLVPQDAKDEPTSVLLERIRAQRAETTRVEAAPSGKQRPRRKSRS